MFNHYSALLALRAKLLTLSVVTTGSTTLAATTTGYTRSSGSFVTDGFQVGMEVTPSGFTTNTARVIKAVTATTLTVTATLTAESAASGRTLAVVLPSQRVWENTEPVNASGTRITLEGGTPYVTEEYIPGPTERITLGTYGELEGSPLYRPTVYVPSNTGRAALAKYADALLTLFAPQTPITLSGALLEVRSNPGPFLGQIVQIETGFAAVAVNVPLRYRTPNSI